jgi:hypothetical protein
MAAMAGVCDQCSTSLASRLKPRLVLSELSGHTTPKHSCWINCVDRHENAAKAQTPSLF